MPSVSIEEQGMGKNQKETSKSKTGSQSKE